MKVWWMHGEQQHQLDGVGQVCNKGWWLSRTVGVRQALEELNGWL
jgi:hypothetical protein